jgi:flagellar basal-body rod protein FlgG
MFQPLYVAATGLDAFQDEVLNITNNLSNAKTTAYKKERTDMESLFYVEKSFKDTLAQAMDQTSGEIIPEFGTGVRVAATSRDFTQGAIQTTNNPLDIAVQGDGFLQFRMPDGSTAYGRAGNLHVDNDGNLVDPNGHLLEPAVILPQGTTGVTIRQDGTVLVAVNNELSQTEIGQINLVKFPNSNGLKNIGQNLFVASSASGDPIMSTPGTEGYGTITQYALESSNVDVISEMMRMVMVQRVFDSITKAVSTYEGMLTTLERMKA